VIAIQGGCVVTPYESIIPGTVLIEGDGIIAVGRGDHIPVPAGADIVDVAGMVVAPGFVDTHVHGRDGVYFGEDEETTARLFRSIASTGVTSLLPTMSPLLPEQRTPEAILDWIRVIRRAMLHATEGAEVLGIHMEGPWLSRTDPTRGAQLAANLRLPSIDELHRMVDVSEGTVRKISLAPELDGALEVIREMDRLGIVPCAAHSTATYEQTMEAVEAGLSCATHVYNGMLPLHHRAPGLLGAVLTCNRIDAELIADGQHVSPVAMQILLRCKGPDRIHLVTDNLPWAGLPDGTYADGQRTIVKEAQRAFVVGGSLAGSVASMAACVHIMVSSVGYSLPQAIAMASLNAARVIGVENRKGSLEPGKDADLVVLDEAGRVWMTIVRGQTVYRREGPG